MVTEGVRALNWRGLWLHLLFSAGLVAIVLAVVMYRRVTSFPGIRAPYDFSQYDLRGRYFTVGFDYRF